MEHKKEETLANDVASIAETQGIEAFNRLQSSALSVSTSSGWLESSRSACLDSLDYNVSNRHNPFRVGDGGLVVRELKVGNFEVSNSAVVGSSNDNEGDNGRRKGCWGHLYQLAGGTRSRNLSGGLVDECGASLSSREEKERRPLGDKELLEPSLTKQESKSLDEVSTAGLADGCKNNRSRILSTSSFAKLFGRQSLKDKGVESKGPLSNDEYHFETTTQSKNQLASSSGKTSDALVEPKATEDPSSHTVDGIESISSHDKINLREWLNSGNSEIRKVRRLQLFRQIVQLVDIAHSEGIGLQDLRPSNFIFVSPDTVKYTGSSTPVDLENQRNQVMTKKRPLELDRQVHSSTSSVKKQKLGKDGNLTRHEAKFISACGMTTEAMIETNTSGSDLQDHDYAKSMALKHSKNEGTSISTSSWLDPGIVKQEKEWYACPCKLDGRSLLSSNIYSLGVLLFELLCRFETSEQHSAAMLDLKHRILPANFLSENPKEAGFCFWLLHPEPWSRPTTREILQSETISSSEEVRLGNDMSSCIQKGSDTEFELLLHFLVSVEEQKQNNVSSLLGSIECLEADIKEVRKRHAPVLPSDWMDKDLTSERWDFLPKDLSNAEEPQKTLSLTNLPEENLIRNISQLEKAYFAMRSEHQLKEISSLQRSDKDLLSNRDRWCQFLRETKNSNTEGRPVDQAGAFFEGVCRFARYSKFEVCGRLKNGDILNSTNVICSLSFDRDEDYIAAAGVSKKIKIFEFDSLLDDSVDIQYSVVEMSNTSKLSCVCWNKYMKNYLASSDYDGVVQMWDVSTGQAFAQYNEHQKRAWSVDFSVLDPAKFSSGSDDCLVKVWCINEKNSTGTIWNAANVCCVQFSAYSSHLLAFGSADYKIYCYDLRHTRIPWCTLSGHGKAVSYVKFLDSETIVSASTDNTLKLWDLKKTSSEGLSSDACCLTFSGHSNEKNFVGLSVLDGYITCGSETNEVYAYYRSLPMPITSHKFGSIDPISGHDIDDSYGQFISSVCWRRKSNILVSANSTGSMKLLRLV